MRTVCVGIVCVLITSTGVRGQTVTERQPAQAPRVMPSGRVVLSEHEGTVVWRASDGVGFTLRTIANFSAPIVWPSPDEPLLRAGLKLPRPFPQQSGQASSTATSRVYFNIPLIVLRNILPCVPFERQAHWPDLDLEWDDEPTPAAAMMRVNPEFPPLDCIQEIKIRYFFYYDSEVGVSAHSNDFESLQVNIGIERNRQVSPPSAGRPAVYLCADGQYLTHCAFVTGEFGSAHGIAWYTNGLNVDRNRDTLLPITVLAEEGKHASSPDRNGDGVYSPGFDVDIHPNDAWGVRDSLRTRWLQGPAFRGDMTKRRRDGDRVFPPYPNWRLAGNWVKVMQPEDPDYWENASPYSLESMTEAEDTSVVPARLYCDPDSDDLSPMVPSSLGCAVGSGLPCERMVDLVRGEEGCRRTRTLGSGGWLALKSAFARINAGGSHDEYLTWTRFVKERLLPGVRLTDSRLSGWWMFPIAWNVPGFDGWVSARWNFFRPPLGQREPQDGAVDLVYSVSAARYFSSYVAVGRDSLPLSDPDPGAHRVAVEGGIKWRFEAPWVGLFSGVRIGIRADDPRHLKYARMLFEFGGGSW
jgi:hypothetical protein